MTAIARQSGRLAGQPAAGGRAFGPLHRLAPARRTGPPLAAGETGLDCALNAARGELEALAKTSGEVGADILAFQLALLADPELLGRARALIASGQSAEEAWAIATATEVDGFLASGSPMLQARAADLADLCRRVLSHLGGPAARPVPPGHIVLADDLAPSEFLAADWRGGGVLLRGGSPAAHLAVLARAHRVPMIVALDGEDAPEATHALIDGDSGIAMLQADSVPPEILVAGEARPVSDRPAIATERGDVEIMVNVSRLAELDALDSAGCDGIGLVRSEFVLGPADLLSEERQVAIYRRLADWARGKPVRIRTVDAGLDKPVPGLSDTGADRSPSLRGLRLSLRRPEIFKVQIRALARAAATAKNLSVLFPMVTTAEEFAAGRALFRDEVFRLTEAGIAARLPDIGAMIEVPAAALAPDAFAGAAFFSIGSNDLFHYTMAIARDGRDQPSVPVDHPAMHRMIAHVVATGRRLGVPVAVCGDVAGDPARVAWLLSCGVRSLSVAPAALALVHTAVRAATLPARAAGSGEG